MGGKVETSWNYHDVLCKKKLFSTKGKIKVFLSNNVTKIQWLGGFDSGTK